MGQNISLQSLAIIQKAFREIAITIIIIIITTTIFKNIIIIVVVVVVNLQHRYMHHAFFEKSIKLSVVLEWYNFDWSWLMKE